MAEALIRLEVVPSVHAAPPEQTDVEMVIPAGPPLGVAFRKTSLPGVVGTPVVTG